jgi:hypothetical protein
VASKDYIVRQAVILLEYAKTIKDPKVSAALIDKAADIKDRDDPLPDPARRLRTSKHPDIR